MSPGDRVAQLYPRHWVSLLVAFYVTQGCGGVILLRSHTEKITLPEELNSENACYNFVKNLIFICFLSKNAEIKMHKATVTFVLYGTRAALKQTNCTEQNS
jgi:hypothetical protein